MDLEVVGRHALLFDDDAMAAFVNSSDALVEWNSLQIDRYDVRHLLSAPPPSRRRSHSSTSSNLVDASIQFELDHERYLDLPSPSDEPGVEEDEKSVDAGAYRAVGFSYGHTDDSADRKSSEAGQESSEFRPSFPVPEGLLQCLPPTEKVHQIIARTALFVSKHGGQSEIVLRVKQGDNPTFGFLMPDHDLHAYFRFLVDHPELLQPGSDVKAQNEGGKDSDEQKEHDGRGGALSLLGSVYESGEDEELANGDDPGPKVTSATLDTLSATNVSSPLERADSSKEFENDEKEKDERVSTNSLRSSKDKEKATALKKNNLINASKSGIRSSMRKEDDGGSSAASRKTKAEVSGLGAVSKTLPLVEPPSDLKKLINKIVEFILKNGKQFESTLMEQDSKHGRFPFLLPTNQYHPYYLKILQKAQESKVHGSEKRASLKESDSPSRSAGYDLPYVSDKKEKFKMVIGKSKKEMQDSLTRTSEQEVGVNVDAAAAAAILHAATRGIKNPNLNIISGSSKNGDSQGHSSEGGQASCFLNVPPFGQRSDQRMKNSVLLPKAKEIAKSAAAEAASEADSSEAHLSKEQKLKAERLRRAKMFVALLKGGAAPVKRDSSHGGLVEPQESALSGSGTEVNAAALEREGSAAPSELTALGRESSAAPSELTALEREGSAAPLINNVSNENEKSEIKHNAEENERRSRRKYRSRSDRPEEEDEEEEGEGEGEGEEEGQRSRKKHRSSREDEEEESGEVRDDRRSKKKKHSRRRRHKDSGNAYEDEDDEDKRSRKKHRRRHSSPEYDEDDKRSRKKPRRRHSSPEDDDDDEDDKRSRKKHRRRHSSPEYDDDERRDAERHHKHGRKKHSSHQSSRENRKDDYEEDYKHSKKKHRSHRTSHRSREKLKHRPKHSSDDESEHEHKRPNSSDDEKQRYGRADKNENGTREREELEEGEIGTKVSDQSRGSLGGSVSREASVDVSSSHQRAASQQSESTEISDDLRAKIRAMLMATRK
ncbi:PREDICTED: splicing factor, suppressor of white-apricot homolog isoform X1 [Nicotiana attenuata]|uniref:splicing factor, suppressor of white-apricot homolog isoform X1 n=1 Tax=Nicotiana attenuata TaxID=49451 RepID=UPI00090463EE|nr:PREDICTED: splicing factor, suppressor of white-apricot homolog isoform X1 [Nicotiana attenuata]